MSTDVPIDDPGAVGRLVRDRRKRLGLQQAEVADLAGTSRKFVYEVEHGKPSLQLDKLIAVLDILGIQGYLRAAGEEAPSL